MSETNEVIDMTEESAQTKELIQANPDQVRKEAGTTIERDKLGPLPRRTERAHKLTEKGRSLHGKTLKGFIYNFDCVYEHWKLQAKRAKGGIITKAPIDELVIWIIFPAVQFILKLY